MIHRYLLHGTTGCVGYLAIKQFGYTFPALFGPSQVATCIVLAVLVIAGIMGAVDVWQETGKPHAEDFAPLALMLAAAIVLMIGIEGLARWLA